MFNSFLFKIINDYISIDDIIKLCNNNIGNKFLKPTKNIKILVKNKKIFFTPNYDLP